MQKLITVLLLAASSSAFAQDKLYPFRIDGKFGITDTTGNEVVKPIHGRCRLLPGNHEIALYNFDDKIKDVIANAQTGQIQTFGYIVPEEVTVNKISYTAIEDKGKKYLRSEAGNKILQPKGDYYDYKNVGKYIVAKYMPPPPPAPPAPAYKVIKDSKGNPIPPPPLPPPPMRKFGEDGYALIAENDETFKPIMKGVFEKYQVLYKAGGSEPVDKPLVIEKTYAIDRDPAFYVIIFSRENTHSVYDADLKLVKKFELKKAEPGQLTEKAEEIMKVSLSEFSNSAYGTPPMAAGPSKYPTTKPAIVYPVYEVEKTADGGSRLLLKQSETDTKVLLECSKKIHWDEDDNLVTVSDPDIQFNIDPQTGKIYLPKKYWATAGLAAR
ncbi:hypothetical protein [Chitinophaga qingshengii]|uniref:WG repeat-containing protein n=1 Tax=Chitinophaga qingshengii TaxID=1569794 RepID=A0ABR7TFR4_9BACT|nr:hypothetical protein [Chitinophaga qingshengii]MBC9929221.1 hypothetical protein [Chitinophaga qingshengii]